MKILFLVGSLRAGGLERRLVELLSYLKRDGNYEMLLMLSYNKIEYAKFNGLGIDVVDLGKKEGQKSFEVIKKVYTEAKKFNPDLIHAWGAPEAFYSVFVSNLLGVPLINNQIADVFGPARLSYFSKMVNKINFFFSDVICANSYGGLKAYGQDKKKNSHVIYNGLDLSRFDGLAETSVIKDKYGIKTDYAVIMAATYSDHKDWDRFVALAKYVTDLRKDITFIGVGAVADEELFTRIESQAEVCENILIKGRCSEVENLVNACDIGVLFSTRGEGVSNAILEYLALGKSVFVDKEGGSSEFIRDGENGFFADGRTIQQLGNLVIELLDNSDLRDKIGKSGKQTIDNLFTLNKMGEKFVDIYNSLL